jgi:hypothetical protein
MPDTPTPAAEWLVYCNEPNWGFINPDGTRRYLLAAPNSSQEVKHIGYHFTASLDEAWKFPTQAQAIQKAIIVNRHIGWSSQGLHKMSTMPASDFPTSNIQHLATSNAAKQPHGGPRTPGPGKKNGRPAKEPHQKSVSLSITFSCQAAADLLKAQAAAAQKTPGAHIEHKLKLLPPPSRRKLKR